MFDKPLAIVDVETTGMSGFYDRIIEIGILRVENNVIVEKLNTLVNPQTFISPFIESFTGIDKENLEVAPLFEDISDKIYRLLDSAILVAHNARFDYHFLKHEFKRIGIPYSSKTLCTAQLSRRLFPTYRRHSLSVLIERYGLVCKNRHRAYDDAFALWQFLEKIKTRVEEGKLAKTVKLLLRSSYSGNTILNKQVEELPETVGVYMFYDKDNLPLYVGKSKNIKERVISHFSSDVQTSRQLQMTRNIVRIDHLKTAGELGALIHEARLVKELQPVYNRKLRRKKIFAAARKILNADGYLSLKLETMKDLDKGVLGEMLGLFKSKKSAKERIVYIAKKYSLCNKLLGMESATSACFEYKLGRCKGACVGKEEPKKYNARFTIAFIENKQFRSWPFAGAIEVYEKNEEEELFEAFTIDNWRLVDPPFEFDLDTYKIISSFLKYRKPNYRVLQESPVRV